MTVSLNLPLVPLIEDLTQLPKTVSAIIVDYFKNKKIAVLIIIPLEINPFTYAQTNRLLDMGENEINMICAIFHYTNSTHIAGYDPNRMLLIRDAFKEKYLESNQQIPGYLNASYLAEQIFNSMQPDLNPNFEVDTHRIFDGLDFTNYHIY